MEIEIKKNPSLQKGKPGSVHLLLLDDNNEVRGTVSVHPKFTHPKEESQEFRVEINKGGLLGPIDIRITV